MTAARTSSQISAWRLSDLESIPDWRERLEWSVPTRLLYDRSQQAVTATIETCANLDNELSRQIAVVGSLRCINAFAILLEAAFAVEAELKGAPKIIGGPPELEMLRGVTDLSSVNGRNTSNLVSRKLRWSALRAIARTASWTAYHRLLRALLAPRATAISHNALLRSTARSDYIGFRHAELYVEEAHPIENDAQQDLAIGEVSNAICTALMSSSDGLSTDLKDRLNEITKSRVQHILEPIAQDVLAIRQSKNLPNAVWSGTSGALTTRLVNTEVLRRNGSVTGFDHGGDTAVSQMPSITALLELAPTSKFVVATPLWARTLSESRAPVLAAKIGPTEIGEGDGDPMFRRVCKIDARQPTRQKPRVVYVIHPFRGFHQYALPYPPDTIYLDFQIRVAETLLDLPIDLLCKPHPEGLLVGQNHPIEKFAPTSYRKFEEHIDDADVFLFDAPTSTTFAEALCTTKKVVWIDRGYHPVNPALEASIAERCHIIKAKTTAHGRLEFDPAELADAVASSAANVDPGYFRELLAGP